ncbi:hypothetical protein LEP1GSC089_0919 [Leptospira interrogans serovar Autumnalis str. LP101]|uniref:hypothetical protein n=1 Tax=Leptospira interrogans TaxID=173 RepID=UPI0002BF6D02|nr:hypothetical protein [Leptospira interrogans]EMN52202.1 hypothetical protein LEP1GSC089_0919 [Leptospira interrogans serovar Autumnalis str. LP101]
MCSLNSSEIIAYLGAGAWLPQIFILIKYLVKRKYLTIILHENCNLLLSNTGPLLTLNLAILAKRGDFLLENIYLELKHEKGNTLNFNWLWQEEAIGNLTLPEFGLIPFQKSKQIVALYCQNDYIEDKQITFYEVDFKRKYDNFQIRLNSIKSNLLRNNLSLEKLKESQEYNELISLYQQFGTLIVGDWVLSLSVKSEGKIIKLLSKKFNLNQTDIKTYSENINLVNESIENTFIKNTSIEFPFTNVIYFNLSDFAQSQHQEQQCCSECEIRTLVWSKGEAQSLRWKPPNLHCFKII